MNERDRIREAYIRMAKEANYRPAAPGDGFGSVDLTATELKDEAVLNAEAARYAEEFIRQEDSLSFYVGVSNWETNMALVYTIEAARLLCSGVADTLALRLLDMARVAVARACSEDRLDDGSLLEILSGKTKATSEQIEGYIEAFRSFQEDRRK